MAKVVKEEKKDSRKAQEIKARHGDTVYIGPEGVEIMNDQKNDAAWEQAEESYEEEQPEQEQYLEDTEEVVVRPGDTIVIKKDGKIEVEDHGP